MRRIAILAPILTAYRLPVYELLGRRFDLTVLHAQPEDNRPGWGEALLKPDASFRARRSWGWVFKLPRIAAGRVFEYRYIQLTPGHLVDLWRLRPQAVIAAEMGPRSLLAVAWGALMRAPVWLWVGETRHAARGAGALRRLLRRQVFARSGCRFISMGSSTTDYLRAELGVAVDRVVQIQNSIDEVLFDAATAPVAHSFAARPVLLHVGQLLRRKGVFELIHAAAALQAEGRRFALVFVGSGDGAAEARALVAELGVEAVEFIGAIAPSDVAAWYAACDAVVFPTLEDVWGLVANEAIRMRRPLLCSIYAGCVDELAPPDYRFDPLDATDFVNALRRAVDGALAPIDAARLRPVASSAAAIVDDINTVLDARAQRNPR